MLANPPLVLATLMLTAAAINIAIPNKITAVVATEIEIGFDAWKQPSVYESVPYPIDKETVAVCRNPADPDVGCGHDMLYENYQLFLTTGYLSDLIPVGTTNPSITIPVDLGPSDEEYSITAMVLNGTKPEINQHGAAESTTFTLAGTNITAWTEWESYGGVTKPWHALPCSSHNCFRTCGLRSADEQGYRKRGTAAAFFDCLKECPGIRADWNDFNSEWAFDKVFDGVDYSGESTSVTTSTPSAISTSGWSRQTTEWPETTLYGTPTVGPSSSSGETATSARPPATAQSSAGRRRAQPPVPKPMGYAGAMAMTVLMCLVAFGIGSILGWIWPDGLRSEW
ncbi:hypothetical protein CT0861_07110 [Colletotrichum tofieldiae]|uniref:Uncharacterized protein n=1 Tax=Colletotrichum tofieldiae TaxID=708197 RepID=A0A166S9C8_9PEZI|nr:hypothetical protein CT0861_07110 [Colletotrichum tofieldiae]GKT88955.1 hypothetical protein Ct61P_06805 [Colletotrichum tofieldiae]